MRLLFDAEDTGCRRSSASFAGAPGDSVRFVTVHTPGGFEGMDREVRAGEVAAGREFAVPEMIAIAQHHDWVLAGPPLLPTGQFASVNGGPK